VYIDVIPCLDDDANDFGGAAAADRHMAATTGGLQEQLGIVTTTVHFNPDLTQNTGYSYRQIKEFYISSCKHQENCCEYHLDVGRWQHHELYNLQPNLSPK
jgi:hypothetical protein